MEEVAKPKIPRARSRASHAAWLITCLISAIFHLSFLVSFPVFVMFSIATIVPGGRYSRATPQMVCASMCLMSSFSNNKVIRRVAVSASIMMLVITVVMATKLNRSPDRAAECRVRIKGKGHPPRSVQSATVKDPRIESAAHVYQAVACGLCPHRPGSRGCIDCHWSSSQPTGLLRRFIVANMLGILFLSCGAPALSRS